MYWGFYYAFLQYYKYISSSPYLCRFVGEPIKKPTHPETRSRNWATVAVAEGEASIPSPQPPAFLSRIRVTGKTGLPPPQSESEDGLIQQDVLPYSLPLPPQQAPFP